MNPPDLHHLAAAYALDALDEAERRAFEAHYPSCEICSREIGEFRETAAILASGHEAQPPASLREAVMADVATTRQLPPIVPDALAQRSAHRRARSWTTTALVAAAAAIVAVVGTVAVIRGSAGSDEVGELLAAPDAVVTSLDGVDGSLRIVWSPDRGRVAIVGEGLADPGDQLTFALWFLGQNGAAPAALFEPDGDGLVRTVLTVADADPIGWGVTIEPAGGSPQPTGEVLYQGSL